MRYEIKGENFPVVICELESGESVVTQGGGMSWMSPNMKMETHGHGLGKVLGRMVTRESLFQNTYVATNGIGKIAFASSLPGSIMALKIDKEHSYIVQKGAYLASTPNIDLSVYLQKKLSSGLFGGEGFLMQKLTGDGTAFIEIDGSAVSYDLAPGQQIIADTGHVVLMSDTCQMTIQTIKGLKNVVFGGEGLFNTVITGPGKVIVQTMPTYKLAQSLIPYLPKSSN